MIPQQSRLAKVSSGQPAWVQHDLTKPSRPTPHGTAVTCTRRLGKLGRRLGKLGRRLGKLDRRLGRLQRGKSRVISPVHPSARMHAQSRDRTPVQIVTPGPPLARGRPQERLHRPAPKIRLHIFFCKKKYGCCNRMTSIFKNTQAN